MTTKKIYNLRTSNGDSWYYENIEDARRDRYLLGGSIRPVCVESSRRVINGKLEEVRQQ